MSEEDSDFRKLCRAGSSTARSFWLQVEKTAQGNKIEVKNGIENNKVTPIKKKEKHVQIEPTSSIVSERRSFFEQLSTHPTQENNAKLTPERKSNISFSSFDIDSEKEEDFLSLSDIEDIEEIPHQISRRKFSISRFADKEEENDLDIGELQNVQGFSYLDNKMQELDTVHKQISQISPNDFSVFGNPMLISSFLQILQAKRKQVRISFERLKITELAFQQLESKVEKVYKNISNLMISNTVRSSKRTSQSLFNIKFQSSHTQIDLDWMIRNLYNGCNTLFQVDKIFEICILEALNSVTEELFYRVITEIQHLKFTVAYLQRLWQKHQAIDYSETLNRVHLLWKFCNTLEKHSCDYSSVSSFTKQLVVEWKYSVESHRLSYGSSKSKENRYPFRAHTLINLA